MSLNSAMHSGTLRLVLVSVVVIAGGPITWTESPRESEQLGDRNDAFSGTIDATRKQVEVSLKLFLARAKSWRRSSHWFSGCKLISVATPTITEIPIPVLQDCNRSVGYLPQFEGIVRPSQIWPELRRMRVPCSADINASGHYQPCHPSSSVAVSDWQWGACILAQLGWRLARMRPTSSVPPGKRSLLEIRGCILIMLWQLQLFKEMSF